MDVSTFVSRVRQVGQFPDNDEDITEAYILQEAYQGLLERFTQPVIMLRNGTWLQRYEFQLSANISQYRLPQRSIAQGLEKVEISLSGEGTSGVRLLNVLTNIQATDYENMGFQNRPVAFTYVGDRLTLFPTPSQSATCFIWYYLRPSALVASTVTDGGFVSAKTDNGNGTWTLTVTSHGYVGPGIIDIQHTTGNCEMIVPGAAYTVADANHLTVTLTQDQAFQIEDETHVNTVDTTKWIQLPQELQNGLVSYVAAVCLAEKGDTEKAQVFSQKAETAIKNIVDIALPRSKGQPSVFKTRNTYLRRRVGRWGFGGWGGM